MLAFISEESCLDIVDRLSPADFYDSKHRVIFEAISQLVAEQKKVDYITLMQKLGKSLAGIGGITYITSLSNAVPAVVSAKHHASIVAELSTRRRIIQAALAIAKQGMIPPLAPKSTGLWPNLKYSKLPRTVQARVGR